MPYTARWNFEFNADVACPWYCAIAGLVSVLVGWLASVALDEFQKGHHAYTVQGQKAVLKTEGRHEKVDGCYQVSGKVHRSSFLLLVFFVLSLAGLWLVNASI